MLGSVLQSVNNNSKHIPRCLELILGSIISHINVHFLADQDAIAVLQIFKIVMSINQKIVNRLPLATFSTFCKGYLGLIRVVGTKNRGSLNPNLVKLIERSIDQFLFFSVNYYAISRYTADNR